MKLNAADLFDTLEVELWDGHTYTLRDVTKSVSANIEKAAENLGKLAEDAPDDDQVSALCDLLAVMLKPSGDAPPVRDVLWKRWEDDELGIDWIGAFVESLQEQAEARRRPTSATPTQS
jgi:hypothetical protein